MTVATLGAVPRFVDLSAPIKPYAAGAARPAAHRHRVLRPRRGRARRSRRCSACRPALLRDGEGWAVETFLRFGTHNSTHVDAPWHYNSTVAGERAQTIDELPLEWFHAPGVVLDFSAREDGDAIDARRRRGRARAHRPRARAAGHRARAHRPRRLLRRARLHGPRPGRDRRGHALALRAGRARHGHRRLGLGPSAAPAGPGGARARRGRASSGPPTRPTSPTRRSSAWPTSARCRARASA